MTENRAEHDFHPIGSQVQRIANSLKATDSIQKRFGPSSSTTGAPLLARAGSSSTGRGPTAIAVANLPTGEADPAATDRAVMDSLPACVRSALKPVWADRFTEHGWDGEIIGYEIGNIPAAEQSEAYAMVLGATEPAPLGIIQSELARMRVSTKSRADTEGEGKLSAAVFAEYLTEYPADVVIWACRRWSRTEKWWPSWAELKDLLDRGVRRRRALLATLDGQTEYANGQNN